MTAELERRSAGMALPADADVMSIAYSDVVDSGEFYQVPGFGLVEDKMLLIGVPHIIIGVTYQMPTPARPRGYVSLRGFIANAEKLAEARSRRWIPGECPFSPEERIVYNDGSTGIRRQITELLDKWNLIDVGNDDFEPSADCGSKYDLPWTDWRSFDQVEVQGENMVPGITKNHNGNLFTLNVARGLRVSEYSNDKVDDAKTFYL